MALQLGESSAAMHASHGDNFQIEIDMVLSLFRSDPSVNSYSFKSTLSNEERKYIHTKCRKYGLKSRSTGKEPNRILCIYKRNASNDAVQTVLNLTKESDHALSLFFHKYSDNADTLNRTNVEFVNKEETPVFSYLQNMAVNHGFIPAPTPNEIRKASEALPINVIRQPLVDLLDKSQIVIITAETGSGKTTQVPQYILENAAEKQAHCRIICTQPRRLSTIAVSERVARERGERLGQIVGYQIKLESELSPQSALIYCTTGVLLRTLMAKTTDVKAISHIIMDEIHERDRFSDFLLVCLKECALNFPHLKIILMSATMDVKLFENYFPSAHVVNVAGRPFAIEEYFLEDILPSINYESHSMRRIRESRDKEPNEDLPQTKPIPQDFEYNEEMEEVIHRCTTTTIDDFSQLMQLILSENVSVNYIESKNGYTPLIAACSQGKVDIVQQLIYMGANVNHPCKDGTTAYMWAAKSGHEDVMQVLSSVQPPAEKKDKNVYSDYLKSTAPEFIDFELIAAIIAHIHETIDAESSILVFLSGYDDIIMCKDAILNSRINLDETRIFMLHGNMNISGQRDVFERIPNKQKIILSTNVAETSITIDDVAFVIDSGRVKEKTYDTMSNTFALNKNWISKASAKQRAGRAGRCRKGYCYHVYPRVRYESMLLSNIPEILRAPLQELCLQTKLLAPKNVSIEHFLLRAIEPPTKIAITKAIDSLKMLGALDESEELTPLGVRLLSLSVEPHLGKMLLYSVVYKCLDPILSIVACLTSKDPFILPTQAHLNSNALAKKQQLSAGALSDHLVLLRAFLLWQSAVMNRRSAQFSEEHFLSEPILEMIALTRIQLMGQLRALQYVGNINSVKEMNKYSESWPTVKAVLLQGLYPNLAYYEANVLKTKSENKITFHKSSVIKSANVNKSAWFMYEELSKINAFASLKCATAVTPCAVALNCGNVSQPLEDNLFTIDNWVDFQVNNNLLYKIRGVIQNVIDLKIKTPGFKFTKMHDAVIDTVVTVLSAEDSALGFTHPLGIGAVPKLVCKHHLMFAHSDTKQKSNIRRHQNETVRSELPGSTSYFNWEPQIYLLVKSPTFHCLRMGFTQSMWKFNEHDFSLVDRHLKNNMSVILIFTICNNRSFCGVARALNEGSNNYKVPVQWLSKNDVPYNSVRCMNLPNFNACGNCYEFPTTVGKELMQTLLNFNKNSFRRRPQNYAPRYQHPQY